MGFDVDMTVYQSELNSVEGCGESVGALYVRYIAEAVLVLLEVEVNGHAEEEKHDDSAVPEGQDAGRLSSRVFDAQWVYIFVGIFNAILSII